MQCPVLQLGRPVPFRANSECAHSRGAIATYGVSKLDNTVLWLGGNVDEGQGIAFRLNGYTPTRISNHDIETIWSTYSTISDVITYTYQTRGHKFWHVYFPTANASWRYDIATQQWHQLGTWNPVLGAFTRAPEHHGTQRTLACTW